MTNLGPQWLMPLDANGNGIADVWETTYFGAGTDVVATEDADADGFSNCAVIRADC